MFVKISSCNSRKPVENSFHKHYILFAFLVYTSIYIPPILRVGFSLGTSNITGYLRQENDEFAGWEALIARFLGGRSNHVTSCAKETNQGSVQFHSLYFLSFRITYFRTLGTMFNLSVRGVNKGRLMIPHRIPLRLIFACLIVIV